MSMIWLLDLAGAWFDDFPCEQKIKYFNPTSITESNGQSKSNNVVLRSYNLLVV